MDAKVVAKETVATPVGQLAAWKIVPAISDEHGKPTGDKLGLWISDDARKLPVKLEADLPIGHFVIVLKEIAGDWQDDLAIPGMRRQSICRLQDFISGRPPRPGRRYLPAGVFAEAGRAIPSRQISRTATDPGSLEDRRDPATRASERAGQARPARSASRCPAR